MNKILSRSYIPAGHLLIREGDEAYKAYYLESGMLEVYRIKSDRSEQRISTIGPGEIVGEFAFFGDQNIRTANVRALEDCTIVSLTLDQINAYIDTMEKPARALFKILMQRLVRANEELTGEFKTVRHLNEASRYAVDTLRTRAADGDELVAFDNEILPLLNQLIEAIREFEKRQDSKAGL